MWYWLVIKYVKVLKVYMKFEKINHTVKKRSVIETPLKTNKIILKSIIYYIHIVVQCSLAQTAAERRSRYAPISIISPADARLRLFR